MNVLGGLQFLLGNAFFKCIFRTHKDNLKLVDAQEEQRMLRGQKEYLELEVRKFRRKKLIIYHQLEQELLRQELNKRQNQLEQAHSMLLRHHEKTQELEYRQQKTVHALREEQVVNIKQLPLDSLSKTFRFNFR